MSHKKKRINKLWTVFIMKNLRYLPAIHELQSDKRFTQICETKQLSKQVLTQWLQEQVDITRNGIFNQDITDLEMNKEMLTEHIFNTLDERINLLLQDNLRHVVNATGVILHTNLGRARLSNQAIKQIERTASAYSTLEYNLTTGKRGSRHELVEEHITELTGAEAAMVVNNNAAAVYLVLKAIACEKEVIVSRGELVEIGGSFRISEIMKESQATLIDVGTTNKTHVYDYEAAISENTALLMKVHKSNFKVVGFTEEVDTDELVHLSMTYDIPIYEDLGSGTLFDFKQQQVGNEPTVQEKVAAGIDLISFSGDKLLGGPQAGIIVGKKHWMDQLKQHQLARVLRVDKFTLAGLEGTLHAYRRGQETTDIPTIRDIVEPLETVLQKASIFINRVQSPETAFSFEVRKDTSKIGGGTMPDVEISTYVVQVRHDIYSNTEIAEKLRNFRIPIIARVQHDAVILDFRTVSYEDLDIVTEVFLSKQ